MQLGNVYVYKCPKCENLVANNSLKSGNSFGVKIYSDGKQIGRFQTEFPILTKCIKCNEIFWLSKELLIGDYRWSDFNSLFKDVEFAKFLSFDDYFTALENKLSKYKENELYIRQKIWWGFNDRVRNEKELFNSENDKILWDDNIHRLLDLLDDNDDEQKLMMAEINRNLGNFDNCMEIISSIDDFEYEWVKSYYEKECNEKNTIVFELKYYKTI